MSYKNGDIRKVIFFIVDSRREQVFAFAEKISVHQQSFVCNTGPRHIVRVVESNENAIFCVNDISEKLFFMCIDGRAYIARLPNMVGHGVFK